MSRRCLKDLGLLVMPGDGHLKPSCGCLVCVCVCLEGMSEAILSDVGEVSRAILVGHVGRGRFTVSPNPIPGPGGMGDECKPFPRAGGGRAHWGHSDMMMRAGPTGASRGPL